MTTAVTAERVCRCCGEPFVGRACVPCRRARSRAWYAAHRALTQARSNAWREANRGNATIIAGRKAWREANAERVRQTERARTLRRNYALTPLQYAEMLAAQSGMCAICAATPASGKVLHIDHDHETGRVRALLCPACNIRVGHHEHRLAAATRAYLKKHEAGA